MHWFWKNLAQLSRYQDAKTTEHVGRVQAECAANTQDSMHKQTCSCLTTTTERLGSDYVRVLREIRIAPSYISFSDVERFI